MDKNTYKLKDGRLFEVDRSKSSRGRYVLIDTLAKKLHLTGVSSICNMQAKPYLITWAASEAYKDCQELTKEEIKKCIKDKDYAHERKSKSSRDSGTEAHEIVEQFARHFIETGRYNIDALSGVTNQEVINSVSRFIDWAVTNRVKFIAVEQSVFHGELLYAGSFDFICEYDGKVLLGDFKTSGKIDDTYWAQTAAYLQAVKYMQSINGEEKIKFDGSIIVKSTKEKEDAVYYTKTTTGAKMVKTPAFEVEVHAGEEHMKNDFNYFTALLTIYRRSKNADISKFNNLPDAPKDYESSIPLDELK